MSILQTGATWLGEQLKNHAGIEGVYAHGLTTFDVTATVAQHEYEIDDNGILTVIVSYDWTFSDLPVTPQKGDTITTSIGTFTVMPLGNRPCFERLDSAGILTTVHTKL